MAILVCIITQFVLCYRLVLRCRQEARTKFAKMRADVLVKMELLDQKHGESETKAF